MTKLRTLAIGVLLFAVLSGGTAFAQGVQDGTIEGTVTLTSGEAAPGVLVTATSPALQGERTTYTAANGNYILRGLPPGDYKVSFTLEGFKPEQTKATVPLGGAARSDARIAPAAVTESILVVGEAASALESPSSSANLTNKTIDSLATPRDLSSIAILAPGVTTTAQTLLPGQFTISGGFAYDNLIMLNGVDINDSIFGNPNNLFIEDAIQETQVLASGISAEYGRFSGGVVNAITKSGGNTFSGTLRSDFSNPSYRDKTPLEQEKGTKIVNKNNEVYSGTLGGYILKDTLWFFAAGRRTNADDQKALNLTGIPFDQQTTDRRYEGKLTANISNNHSFQASYIKNDTSFIQTSVDPTIAATLDTVVHESQPNDLKVLRYAGVWTANLFTEAQYSQKNFTFKDAGGKDPSIINSPFRCASVTCVYNGPYFDATDPEDRDNKQFAGSLSYLVEGAGTHNLKVGGEEFKNLRTGGNSQSPSNFVFFSDFKTDANGKPVFDSAGHLIPVFIPNTFQSFLVFWDAHRGSRFETKADSVYINDEWKLNGHWSFNLGARYEKVGNSGSDNVKTVNASAVSPRLAAAFDPTGNGKFRLAATYAEYAGAYNLGLFTNGTNTGNPGYLYGPYIGPPGEGRNFAPGFDPHNYDLYIAGSPTQNVHFANNVSAPIVKEETVSAGMMLAKGGYAKLLFVNRKTSNFLENFVSTDLGSTRIVIQGVPGPLADNVLFKNTNDPVREYQALALEGRYSLTSNWTVEGNWVHQLKNDGNYVVQTGQVIGTSGIDAFKELFSKERNFPVGHLPDYEADVARIWTIYHFGLGRAGDLSLSLLGSYNSPLTYSFAAGNVRLTSTQRALNPGYHQPPSTQTIYFGKRGSQQFNSWKTFDFAANYQIPIFRSISPWLKVEVRNVFNDKTLIGWNTTIIPNSTGPKDSLGLPTTFHKSPQFGTAEGNFDYPVPRQYFFSLGFRF